MAHRLKVIGVMGSATGGFPQLSRPLGKWIAESGYHLLTGGGSGVMAEVSRSFCKVEDRAGRCIGVIRNGCDPGMDATTEKRSHIPLDVNEWVEIPIYTHLHLSGVQSTDPMSRNHINVLSSDIVIALPGGPGTYSEIQLRLEDGRPVILFIGDETVDGRFADQLISELNGDTMILVADIVNELPYLIQTSLQREGFA